MYITGYISALAHPFAAKSDFSLPFTDDICTCVGNIGMLERVKHSR